MMIWWYDDMVIWWYGDTMIRWYDNTMIRWYDNTMIWWYDDMMIWWYDIYWLASFDRSQEVRSFQKPQEIAGTFEDIKDKKIGPTLPHLLHCWRGSGLCSRSSMDSGPAPGHASESESESEWYDTMIWWYDDMLTWWWWWWWWWWYDDMILCVARRSLAWVLFVAWLRHLVAYLVDKLMQRAACGHVCGIWLVQLS